MFGMGVTEYRDALPNGPAHRRGAGLNPGNRFEATRLHLDGDERDRQRVELQAQGDDPDRPRAVALTVLSDQTKTLINRVAATSDVPFNWTVNPYRGCEHGCIYCFARPYHEFLGFSMGLDFETKIMAKHEAPELLKRELAKPAWRGEPIVMSAITDIYQPIEKRLGLSRRCLEVMAACGQPVSTMTKNTLVLRDLDLWLELGSKGAGRVVVTLVTLDDALAGRLEPRASPPSARLRIVRELAEAGVPVGVNIAPVIPGLTDHELPALMEAAADAGATRVAWVLLRLPYQLKDLFLDWLQRHVHPDRARHVESLIRQSHGGKLYDAGPSLPARGSGRAAGSEPRDMATAGTLGVASGTAAGHGSVRGRGSGAYARQIKQVFDVHCRRLSLNRDIRPLSGRHFRRPARDGQLGLFG